jgi:hypothetical protein
LIEQSSYSNAASQSVRYRTEPGFAIRSADCASRVYIIVMGAAFAHVRACVVVVMRADLFFGDTLFCFGGCPVSVVRRLCANVKSEASGHDDKDPLQQLKDFWLVANADRLSDGGLVADMDERFHLTLVVAAGNPEMARGILK